MSEIKVIDGIAIRGMGDFVLAVWSAPARVERGRMLYDEAERIMAANSGGVLWLQVVLETASPPDGPMRKENDMRLRKWGDNLRRIVTIPDGSAVYSALVSTIMRTMFLVTGQSKKQLVRGSVRDGFDILLKEATARTPPRETLENGVDELYRALGVARQGDRSATGT